MNDFVRYSQYSALNLTYSFVYVATSSSNGVAFLYFFSICQFPQGVVPLYVQLGGFLYTFDDVLDLFHRNRYFVLRFYRNLNLFHEVTTSNVMLSVELFGHSIITYIVILPNINFVSGPLKSNEEYPFI